LKTCRYKDDTQKTTGLKKIMEVDSCKILPLDPNTPNPFSTEYKCHPPSGRYMGRGKKAMYLNV